MNRLLVLITAITFISSCKKSEDNSSGGGPALTSTSNQSILKATVNGHPFTSDSVTAELTFDTLNAFRSMIVLGYDSPTFIFPAFGDLILSENISNVNYTQPQGAYLLYTDTFADWNDYIPESCTFRITSVNYSAHKVSGTFSGVVVYDGVAYAPHDTVVISNGTFTNVPYTTTWQ
jgi:hypothetical protein